MPDVNTDRKKAFHASLTKKLEQRKMAPNVTKEVKYIKDSKKDEKGIGSTRALKAK